MRKIALITTVMLLVCSCRTAPVGSEPEGPVTATPEAPSFESNVFKSAVAPLGANRIDQLVFPKLTKLGIKPVLCSDAVFVRRVYLDVIGTLPSAQEAREFILDPDTKNKRRRLIEQLLARDEYADYWAMKWGDILRIKAEFPVNLWPNAAQAYHRWVRASIAENKPYDQFARELLTSSGSNFRVGPVNFYRAIQGRTPEGITAAVALTFMGARVEAWPKERVAGMAAFFSQVGYKPTREWKEEHVYWNPVGSLVPVTNSLPGVNASNAAVVVSLQSTNPVPRKGVFPDGKKMRLPEETDPREVFTDWLIHPKNPFFARTIVNRQWAWLMGRGIIEEPDDIRDDNPPSNPKLLAYLEQELVANHYDLKHIYRLILNSETYQLSSMPRANSPQAEANFASYKLRRLDAEVLIDAINKITGASDLYTSAIPEPFTYIPADKPAIALPDGSISSLFLALFGRSARATGLVGERDNRLVPPQSRHLLISSHIQKKIEQGPNLKALFKSNRKQGEMFDELFLTILSRFPTAAEVQAAGDYTGSVSNSVPVGKPKNRDVKRNENWWMDVTWSLINSTEFLYRH